MNTSHDPLCGGRDGVRDCHCRLIARVRADERARWSPPQPVVEGHAAVCWCPSCHTAHDANERSSARVGP